MLGSEFHFREKIPLGVLGHEDAKHLSKLIWFNTSEFVEAKPDNSSPYYALIIANSDTEASPDKVISVVEAGYSVVTNIPTFSKKSDVPLIVPEVNIKQLDLLKSQNSAKGKIIAVPNGAATALSIAFKPLLDIFGIDSVLYQGPEKNIEIELFKILAPESFKISSLTGPTHAKVLIRLKNKTDFNELIDAWEAFNGLELELVLPSSYRKTIRYAKDGKEDSEAAVTITNLKEVEGDYQFEFNLSMPDKFRRLSLVAELMVRMGYVYW